MTNPNEMSKQAGKICPVCNKEYPQEDNYCGNDGSPLETVAGGAGLPGAEGSA
ncbi:MAG TPA: hypothetical protein VJQ56_01500 [Blastocatellia bacterium]|nr:hypothetical protein [Blastocatellia bacterium]